MKRVPLLDLKGGILESSRDSAVRKKMFFAETNIINFFKLNNPSRNLRRLFAWLNLMLIRPSEIALKVASYEKIDGEPRCP